MNKVIPLVPKDAWSLLQENPRSVLIDVRSSMEFLFVGHLQGAISLPWIDEPHWVVDPHWLTHVRQLMLGGAFPATKPMRRQLSLYAAVVGTH